MIFPHYYFLQELCSIGEMRHFHPNYQIWVILDIWWANIAATERALKRVAKDGFNWEYIIAGQDNVYLQHLIGPASTDKIVRLRGLVGSNNN